MAAKSCGCFVARRGFNDRAREEFRRAMLERQRTWTPGLAGGPIVVFHGPPFEEATAYDEYGMARSGGSSWSSALRAAEKYESKRQARQAKLRDAWKRWLLLGRDNRVRQTKTLKRLLRRGVPDELRAEVWTYVLGSDTDISGHFSATEYTKFVANRSLGATVLHQIELDVTRTFPRNHLFQTSDGIARLQRVLRAFAAYRPSVGYCQSLNFLAGTFLIFMDEELAFWSMVRLIIPHSATSSGATSSGATSSGATNSGAKNSGASPPDCRGLEIVDYYEPGMTGLRRDLQALRVLMHDWVPLSLAQLEACQVDLSCLCSEWFLCLFVTTLPFRTVLRLFDCLLFEGTKIIFRVALSLMREFNNCAKHRTVNVDWIMHYFKQSLAESGFDHEALLAGALGGFTGFSKSDIIKARAYGLQKVHEEDRARKLILASRVPTRLSLSPPPIPTDNVLTADDAPSDDCGVPTADDVPSGIDFAGNSSSSSSKAAGTSVSHPSPVATEPTAVATAAPSRKMSVAAITHHSSDGCCDNGRPTPDKVSLSVVPLRLLSSRGASTNSSLKHLKRAHTPDAAASALPSIDSLFSSSQNSVIAT